VNNWISRAKLSALNILNPWRRIRELREENERLAKIIGDPMLTGIQIGNGSLHVGMEGIGPGLVAGMFVGMLETYPDATNYVELQFESHIGPIVVTVMKPNGKTPHELRVEAERLLADYIRSHKLLMRCGPL
jgi:hypothetical protein